MAEYIEREAAMDAVRTAGFYSGLGKMNLDNAVIALRYIPAADVRPVVRGTWEESADQLQANCSACKTSFPCWRMWPANFCPNCGADMREES